MEPRFNPALVVVSIVIAILHSYVAFDVASRISIAKGRSRVLLTLFGGLTLGIGIWSMHFIGMFAMEMAGMDVTYGRSLVLASFAIAAINAVLALYLYTRRSSVVRSRLWGAAWLAIAIAGMHYMAMYSMRMAATLKWNLALVAASILIALLASFKALALSSALNRSYAQALAFPSRDIDHRGPLLRGSIYMGLAIAGMHYTGMSAATFVHSDHFHARGAGIMGTTTLSVTVVVLSMLTLGISIIVGDVDRRLAMSAARLRREQTLRNLFVSAIVHDLRNPLSTAMLNLQRISRSGCQRDHQAMAETSLTHLRRVDGLIQSVLDAQRISVGEALPVHLEHVELRAFLRGTLDGLCDLYGNRFQLECHRPLEGDWDPGFLRRAIENLCTNAVKYGAKDAPIKVSAASTGAAHERVAIQIQNQGEPLSPDDQEGLFELFKRGRRADQTGATGWGLGLTIVKGVAEAHGGTVDVVSSRERGTVFTLEMPLHA